MAGAHEGVAATAVLQGKRWRITKHPHLAGRIARMKEMPDGTMWFLPAVNYIRAEEGHPGGHLGSTGRDSLLSS